MGLREQAKLDARAILEDDSGFAWPVTLTSPLGVVTALRGFTTDVGQTIDPETGQAVAGRRASVALAMSSLPAMPEAVSDRSRKPWLATFADSAGVVATWKVVDVLPDRATGVVVLILEVFKSAIVVLGGALTLPRLQLTGALPPKVTIDGALTLPSPLQVSGSLTAGALAQADWLRASGATLVSGKVSSLPEIVNANPAVQASDPARPAIGTSVNGLPILQFGAASTLSWPVIAANNSRLNYGLGFWFRAPATTVANFFNRRTTAGAADFQLSLLAGVLRATIIRASGGSSGSFLDTPAVIAANTWYFFTAEYVSTTINTICMTVNGVVQGITRTTFGTVSNLGQLQVAVTLDFGLGSAFDFGPEIYLWQAAMPGAAAGQLLTPAGRAAFMNYNQPT